MPKPGDRVVVEGSKVGGGRREGTLVETLGSLIKVRWADGAESIMAPGAGAVRFLPGSRRAGGDGGGAKRPAGRATSRGAAKTPARAKAAKKR